MSVLTPSSFDKKCYDKLKYMIGIKKKMLQLTAENIFQTGDEILSNNVIIGIKNGVLDLSQCFIDIVSFYPQNFNFLFDLFLYLFEKKSESNFLDYLPNYLVTCIHTRENIRSSALFFIRKLFLQGIISYNLIINEINNLPPYLNNDAKLPLDVDVNQGYYKNTNQVIIENEFVGGDLLNELTAYSCANRNKFKVILWFYPEIKQRCKSFSISNYLQIPKDESIYLYKPNQFIENINNGFCPDPLARMIRKDDLDAFSLSCSQLTR